METKIVDGCQFDDPKLKEIISGALVQYQNHVYIKLEKKKLGSGISIKWPHDHCILFNPRYGTLRAVNAEIRVPIMEQVSDLEVYKLTKSEQINCYRRSKCY